MANDNAIAKRGLKDWFMQGVQEAEAPSPRKAPAHKHSWWQVMCLTGVDYFRRSDISRESHSLPPACCRRSQR